MQVFDRAAIKLLVVYVHMFCCARRAFGVMHMYVYLIKLQESFLFSVYMFHNTAKQVLTLH